MHYYAIQNVGTFLGTPWAMYMERQLWLSQVIAAAPEIYRTKLRLVRGSRLIKDIILDNGAYEDCLVPDDLLLGHVMEYMPHTIVLPDMPDGDGQASEDRAYNFVKMMTERKLFAKQGIARLIYVPQGRDKLDTLVSFERLFKNPRHWCWTLPTTVSFVIGIGRSYRHWSTDTVDPATGLSDVKTERPREAMWLDLQTEFAAQMTRWHFHILGGRRHATRMWSRFSNITGLDAYEPCRWAVQASDPLEASHNRPVPHSSLEAADAASYYGFVREYCQQYNMNEGTIHWTPSTRTHA